LSAGEDIGERAISNFGDVISIQVPVGLLLWVNGQFRAFGILPIIASREANSDDDSKHRGTSRAQKAGFHLNRRPNLLGHPGVDVKVGSNNGK
jgi:hypothetical protein